MCGRFALAATAADLVSFFQIRFPEEGPQQPGPLEAETAVPQGLLPPIAPRYNVAPGQPVLVARAPQSDEEPRPALALLHWGLVPGWSKGTPTEVRRASYKMINARSETAFERPAFRQAMSRRRCVVPANGFYEWSSPEGWRKGQPRPATLIHGEGRGLLALAGLWERWHGPEGVVESCTILTTVANATVAPLHDRMPVILAPRDLAPWLDPQVQAPELLRPLLVPAAEGLLHLTPVGTTVNSSRTEGEACWQAVTD